MSLESIQESGSFMLKPGGMMEEGLQTDLPGDQYTQVSGITERGTLRKMPGKILVKSYADRVFQVASFGGAVVVQHGSTVEIYPDACSLGPDYVADATTPEPGDGGGGERSYIFDFPSASNHQINMPGAYLRGIDLFVNEGSVGAATAGSFDSADLYDNPDDNPPTGKKQVDLTAFLLPFLSDPNNKYSIRFNYNEYTAEELTYNRTLNLVSVVPAGTTTQGGDSVTIAFFKILPGCASFLIHYQIFIPRPD